MPTAQLNSPFETKPLVDVLNRNERLNLANHFGISEEQLKKAIRLVGPRISTIRAYLGK